jgi:cob(I)alamin adenosyltransferase
MNQTGLIHIYTGDGKGKTTAALGLGLRAAGRGFKVLLVQFLKGRDTGELAVLQRLGLEFVVRRNPESKKFIKDLTLEERRAVQTAVAALWKEAVAAALHGDCDLLILDEIMAAVHSCLVSLDAVETFLQQKPPGLEVVLTGRNAPRQLVKLADYVSEVKAVKHPYEQGISARKGIEY